MRRSLTRCLRPLVRGLAWYGLAALPWAVQWSVREVERAMDVWPDN